MRVTILVALYKAGAFLKAKLESLRSLTNFEDCSIVLLNCQNLEGERETYSSFLQFPNVKEIMYSEHRRLYSTWNDGIKATDTPYIANSNVDDITHPEWALKCANFLDANPEIAVVSSYIIATDFPNQGKPPWTARGRMPEYVYPLSTAGPSPMWRRSLHEKYGYFSDCRAIGDALMWEKWYYIGGEKFALLPEDLVLYYLNPNSLERQQDSEGHQFRDLDLHEQRP